MLKLDRQYTLCIPTVGTITTDKQTFKKLSDVFLDASLGEIYLSKQYEKYEENEINNCKNRSNNYLTIYNEIRKELEKIIK